MHRRQSSPPRNRSVADYYIPLKLTKRPDDILILIIAQGLIAIIYGGINARKIFVYFYFLPTTITALFLPRTPLLSTPTRKRRSKKRSKKDKKSATMEDPGGLSLVLPVTTPSESPQPPATATPSLQISDTILGILLSFS